MPARLASSGEPLGLLNVPVQHGAHPAQRERVPAVLRHAQLVRKSGVQLQLAIDARDVSEFEQRPEPVRVSADHRLAVAGALPELDHLIGDREPDTGGVRPGRNEDLARQGRRQGGRRIDLPGDLDRLVDQSLRLADVVVHPVHLGGLRAEQCGPSRGSLRPDPLQGLVEQGEQLLVEPTGVAQQRDADGGADQAVGVVQPPRRLGRPLERGAGIRHPGGLGLGAPEGEQEAAAQRLVGLLHQLEHLEGPVVDLDRVLVGELLHVLGAGALCVVDRLGEVAAWGRFEEVMGELAEALIDVAAADLLDREAGALVERRALRRAELVVERVANKRVGEGEAPVTQIGHEPLCDRLPGRLHQLLRRLLGHPPDQILVEVASDDRGHPERLVRRVAEAVETAADHLAHALWDLQVGEAATAGELPLAREQPDHLTDEEGIAVGLLLHRLGESRGRRGAGGHLDVSLDGTNREAAQQDPPAPLDARDLAENPGEGMVAAELDVTVGPEDQQAARGELPGGEPEQQQRRFVRPVEVIEDDHQRPVARRSEQQAGH